MNDCALDVYDENWPIDLAAERARGVRLLIIKATHGTVPQRRFNDWRREAAKVGMAVAAYHFGTGENVQAQADAFIAAAGDTSLLFLDYDNPTDMSADQARQFLDYVDGQTGNQTGFYVDDGQLHSKFGGPSDPQMASRILWVAKYQTDDAPAPMSYQPGVWDLWQFWGTDHGRNGAGHSHYNGSAAELASIVA